MRREIPSLSHPRGTAETASGPQTQARQTYAFTADRKAARSPSIRLNAAPLLVRCSFLWTLPQMPRRASLPKRSSTRAFRTKQIPTKDFPKIQLLREGYSTHRATPKDPAGCSSAVGRGKEIPCSPKSLCCAALRAKQTLSHNAN
jgi:hypothetical protein